MILKDAVLQTIDSSPDIPWPPTSQISLSISDSTVMTYIPPIERPITDYGTILEIFRTSRKLTKQSNMQYTHITFDLGAAIKHIKLYGIILMHGKIL